MSVFLILALALPGCQTVDKAKTDADAEAVYTYTDWDYGTTTTKDGTVLFFGSTSAQRSGAATRTGVFINSIVGQCEPRQIRIGIELEAPAEKEITAQKLTGELRIDDQQPVPVEYMYYLDSGKKIIWIDTENIFGNKSFTEQFKKGQMFRFKVTVENKVYNLRFSLRNHLNSIQTAVGNCKEAEAFQGGGKPGLSARPVGQAKQSPSSAPSAPSKADNQDDDARFFQK